jgi:hypothetical protein
MSNVVGEGVDPVISGSQIAVDEQSTSLFRPVILLAATYLINGIVHESAHALMAYALNVPFTLFHFAVDLARDRGTLMERAAIGVAGPLCSLIIGLICWLFYKRVRGSRSELVLLYLAVFGVGTFFGNLMSTAFVGDFQPRGPGPAPADARALRRKSDWLPVSLRPALLGRVGIAQAVASWIQQLACNDRNGCPPSGRWDGNIDAVFPTHAFYSGFRAVGGSIVLGLRGGWCINEWQHSVR